MKTRYIMYCPFRSNVGYVNITPIIPYRTNKMLLSGHTTFYRILKINSKSISRSDV